MLKQLKEINSNNKYNTAITFLLGGIIGALLFLMVYGYKILNVSYTDWLYENINADLFQTQLGLDFFIKSPWKFPLGCYDTYAYPSGTSIVYTDSIPLFAIFFKIIRGILPNKFQYLGLWGMFSFIMQGGLSSLILRKYIPKLRIILAICPIFVCSTAVIWRLFRHTSLGGQWIILLAMLVCVYREKIDKTWKKILIWSCVTALTVSIHVYFIIMIGIMMVSYLINDYMENRKLKDDLLIFISSVMSTVISFYIIGGFAIGGSINEDGLGVYSMNINSLFNSMGYSRFLKGIPSNQGQYEGLQYLGLGVIIILLLYIFNLNKEDYIKFKNTPTKLKLPVFFAVVSLTALALSPIITINSRVLVNYMWVKPIVKLLNPFRSTGRFFWPVFYMIVFAIVIGLASKFKYSTKIFICFILCSSIQISDFVGNMAYNSEALKSKMVYDNKLNSPFWSEVLPKIKHVELITTGWDEYQRLAWYAAQNNLTMNTGYFSRKNLQLIQNDMINSLKEICNNNIKEDTIYCIPEKLTFNGQIFTSDKIVELKLDGYRVIVDKDIIDESKYKNVIIKENYIDKSNIVSSYEKMLSGEL